MRNTTERKFRMITPASGLCVFSGQIRRMTALGSVSVATSANEVENWQVEVIDENRKWLGPKDKQGLPDHEVLQETDPAVAVGFYAGLSSTAPRIYELAKFYHQSSMIVAGGKHAQFCPEFNNGS